jgi:hypothetical protein
MRARTNFPKNPQDGYEVIDIYGTRYKYDVQTASWLTIGTITAPPVASEENNGLVDPEIYQKLDKIKKYVDNGGRFNSLKLRPGTDAYYYLFHSSDKTIRFSPESNNIVRIEVDRGRIYSLYSKIICVGPKGEKGLTGDRGPDGRTTEFEICYTPTTKTGKKVEFSAVVPLGFDRTVIAKLPNNHVPDISIRFYKVIDKMPCDDAASPDQTKTTNVAVLATDKFASTFGKQSVQQKDQITVLEKFLKSINIVSPQLESFKLERQKESLGLYSQAAACSIPLSGIVAIGQDKMILDEPVIEVLIDPYGLVPPRYTTNIALDFTKTSASYNPTTGLVCLTLVATGDVFVDEYCIKARQKGPDGQKGCAGERTIKIIKRNIDNSNVAATTPITNIRFDDGSETMHYTAADIRDETCAVLFQPNAGSALLNNALAGDSVYLAAEMTVESCKRFNHYTFDVEVPAAPDLELPHWTPQPGCRTSRDYYKQKFDWVSTLDPNCEQNLNYYRPEPPVTTSTTGSTAVTTQAGQVSGQYLPFDIKLPTTPPQEAYNQADFFYIPNIQNGVAPQTPPSTSGSNIVDGGSF